MPEQPVPVETLTPENYPAGTRFLYRRRGVKALLEGTVLEWSPVGRCHVRARGGSDQWWGLDELAKITLVELVSMPEPQPEPEPEPEPWP